MWVLWIWNRDCRTRTPLLQKPGTTTAATLWSRIRNSRNGVGGSNKSNPQISVKPKVEYGKFNLDFTIYHTGRGDQKLRLRLNSKLRINKKQLHVFLHSIYVIEDCIPLGQHTTANQAKVFITCGGMELEKQS